MISKKIGFGTFLSQKEDAYQSVRQALRIGYRLIDTAAVYENEREVGKAIADSGIDRREIIVSTKLYAKNVGFEQAVSGCLKSLENLNLKYVDIYFIHWMPRRSEDLLDTWRGLEHLLMKGYCKAIGICNITLYYLDRLLKDAKIPPMFCQIELHPFLQQKIFLEYCKNHHIVVMGYGLFAKGLVFKNEELNNLAEKMQLPVANMVLSWAMSCSIIPLVKSIHLERIESNFKDNRNLLDVEIEEIKKMNDGVRVYRDPENNPYV